MPNIFQVPDRKRTVDLIHIPCPTWETNMVKFICNSKFVLQCSIDGSIPRMSCSWMTLHGSKVQDSSWTIWFQTTLKPFLLTTTFCQNIYPLCADQCRAISKFGFTSFAQYLESSDRTSLHFSTILSQGTLASSSRPISFVSKQISNETLTFEARLILWILHFNIDPFSLFHRNKVPLACWWRFQCWSRLCSGFLRSFLYQPLGTADSLTYFQHRSQFWSKKWFDPWIKMELQLQRCIFQLICKPSISKTGPNRSLLPIHPFLHIFLSSSRSNAYSRLKDWFFRSPGDGRA